MSSFTSLSLDDVCIPVHLSFIEPVLFGSRGRRAGEGTPRGERPGRASSGR